MYAKSCKYGGKVKIFLGVRGLWETEWRQGECKYLFFFPPKEIHEEGEANNPSGGKNIEWYESRKAQYDGKPTFIKQMCSRFQANWQVIMMWNVLLWMSSCSGAHRKSTICTAFRKCFAIFAFRQMHSWRTGFISLSALMSQRFFALPLNWHLFLSPLFCRNYVNYTNAVWSLCDCKRRRCFSLFSFHNLKDIQVSANPIFYFANASLWITLQGSYTPFNPLRALLGRCLPNFGLHGCNLFLLYAA